MITPQSPRRLEAVLPGRPTSDGAGVRLTRLLHGAALQRRLDPFLMLDAFGSDEAADYLAGFPDHPHRGFETITCMIEGRMRHRDSAGHEGLLCSGGVQWMTAGRGVIHSEMPEQIEGRMEGFQIWLNLPARDKMQPADYRDFAPQDIPSWQDAQRTVRVVAGVHRGVVGAVHREATQPLVLDVHLTEGATFEQALPADHHAAFVVYRGEARVGDQVVAAHQLALWAQDPACDGLEVHAGPAGARLLLLAGRPLHEPIAQYGPFVMNTQDELIQAVQDFQAGRLV